MQTLDLQRYSGQWHEIAHRALFQRLKASVAMKGNLRDLKVMAPLR